MGGDLFLEKMAISRFAIVDTVSGEVLNVCAWDPQEDIWRNPRGTVVVEAVERRGFCEVGGRYDFQADQFSRAPGNEPTPVVEIQEPGPVAGANPSTPNP